MRRRPEDLVQALLLVAVAGFLDAYTFVGQRGVFANAQTGNVVLASAEGAEGHWTQALHHLPAIGAFVLGVLLTSVLARPGVRARVRRPTRVVLLTEILALGALGAAGHATPSSVVISAVALVAALQVGTFGSIGDTSYSPTLTTSNLRRLVETGFAGVVDRDRAARRTAARLGAILLAFAAGAALGAGLTHAEGARASWCPAALLLAVLALIWTQTRQLKA